MAGSGPMALAARGLADALEIADPSAELGLDEVGADLEKAALALLDDADRLKKRKQLTDYFARRATTTALARADLSDGDVLELHRSYEALTEARIQSDMSAEEVRNAAQAYLREEEEDTKRHKARKRSAARREVAADVAKIWERKS